MDETKDLTELCRSCGEPITLRAYDCQDGLCFKCYYGQPEETK